MINGGAELYLEHGFQRAMSQEYEGTDGLRLILEIFQMENARGVDIIRGKRNECNCNYIFIFIIFWGV
jgi:hypothetical protein